LFEIPTQIPIFFIQNLMKGRVNIEHWKELLSGDLPGKKAQWLMAPEYRGENGADEYPIPAAILILMYPLDGKTGLVFMKRNEYDGPHSAEVSFPGGAWEEADGSLARTAVRETREELGVTGEIELLGQLTDLDIPVSNFRVTPFVAHTPEKPVFRPDPSEVQYVIESTVEALLDPSARKTETLNFRGMQLEVPFYDVNGEKIWGATAMMLCEFLQLAARLPARPR
jgi:8-oxo-dGTP pyrophosphatase MutT (NUDIX family)